MERETIKFLFYSSGFIFLASELIMFLGLREAFNFKTETSKQYNKTNGSLHNLSTIQKAYICLSVFYWLWALFGLTTFQWQGFLLFLLYSAIKKDSFWFYIIDTIVSFVFVLFLIVNGFKYHIPLNIFF